MRESDERRGDVATSTRGEGERGREACRDTRGDESERLFEVAVCVEQHSEERAERERDRERDRERERRKSVVRIKTT